MSASRHAPDVFLSSCPYAVPAKLLLMIRYILMGSFYHAYMTLPGLMYFYHGLETSGLV